MAILHSCCCWNVRTGSMASGVYTLILAIINGGLIMFNLMHLPLFQPEDTKQEVQEESVSRTSAEQQTGGTDHAAAFQGWFLTLLVVCILMLIASVTLIIGVHKDNRFMFLPWMAVSIGMVALDTAVLIYECVMFGQLTFNIIQMVIWLALTMVNFYSILCVISQYQELKAGRGTAEYIHRMRATIIYRPGIQQVHITQGPIVMTFPGTVSSSTQVQHGPAGQSGVSTTVTVQQPSSPTSTVSPTTDEPPDGASGTECNTLTKDKDGTESLPPPPYEP